MIIQLGSKVEGNWGAMHPTSSGVITAINDDEATIDWGDQPGDHIMEVERIHQPGYRSVNGSPIGVFVVEE